MKYSKERCKDMTIDPTFIGDYKKKYPDLEKCIPDNFKVNKFDFDMYMQYCALVFDPRSPAINDYPDLKMRKEKVLEMVRYKGETDRRFEIKLLLEIFNNRKFTLLITVRNIFDDYSEKSNMTLEGIDDEEKILKASQMKTKLVNDMFDLMQKESQLLSEIFYDDSEVIKEVLATRFTPETINNMGRKKR